MASPDPAAVAIRGSWWRHAPLGGDPWHRPAVPANNRWQRGHVVAALYLADSPETAWAEWYRHLAERAIPPMQTLPRELWRWHVDLARVADLRSREALAERKLAMPRPNRADWPRFQRVGEALHQAGWPALVAASAARPSGLVLCVFRRDREQAPGIEPVPPPERVEQPPAPPRGMTT
jgi:RES domain-containing protein